VSTDIPVAGTTNTDTSNGKSDNAAQESIAMTAPASGDSSALPDALLKVLTDSTAKMAMKNIDPQQQLDATQNAAAKVDVQEKITSPRDEAIRHLQTVLEKAMPEVKATLGDVIKKVQSLPDAKATGDDNTNAPPVQTADDSSQTPDEKPFVKSIQQIQVEAS